MVGFSTLQNVIQHLYVFFAEVMTTQREGTFSETLFKAGQQEHIGRNARFAFEPFQQLILAWIFKDPIPFSVPVT